MSARFHGGNARASGRLTRFVNPPKTEPSSRQSAALRDGHPVVVEGRTLFPTRVFNPEDRPYVLIPGHNNAKVGSHVTKGPWAGFPIFTLSLEERATCPRSCPVWRECYGNSLPMAVRFRNGPALIRALDRNLAAHQQHFPRGFVVRLHVLGDFVDSAYVAQWWRYMQTFPALHVFGYTAHPVESEVGKAVRDMNTAFAGRWAVRFSVAPQTSLAPMQAAAAWDMAETAPGIVCPAETGKTSTCGTCGLCWAPAAADKRIVFLGHGMNRNRRRKPTEMAPAVVESASKVAGASPPMPSAPSIEPAGDFVAWLRQGRAAFDAMIAFFEQPVPPMVMPAIAPAIPATVAVQAQPEATVVVEEPAAEPAPPPPHLPLPEPEPEKRKRNLTEAQRERLRQQAANMRAKRLAKYQRGDGSTPPVFPPAAETKATPATTPDPSPTPPANAPAPAREERPSVPAAPQPASRMDALMRVSQAIDKRVSSGFAKPFGKATEKRVMPGAPTDVDVARFIAERGVTRLPAAAVEETTAEIPPEDREILKAHLEAMEAMEAKFLENSPWKRSRR